MMKTLLGVFSILPGIVDMSFSRKRLNMCATLTGERRETHVPQIPGELGHYMRPAAGKNHYTRMCLSVF